MKNVKDAKDVAEALKAIGERLDAIERLLGAAMRALESIEVSTGSGHTFGKGPTDAYGNLMPHC